MNQTNQSCRSPAWHRCSGWRWCCSRSAGWARSGSRLACWSTGCSRQPGRMRIGHASLFCMLGLLLLAAIPALRRRPWLYLGLVLLAGLGQEAFQMLYKGRLQSFDSARDIATDLLGGLVALGLALALARWRTATSSECWSTCLRPSYYSAQERDRAEGNRLGKVF